MYDTERSKELDLIYIEETRKLKARLVFEDRKSFWDKLGEALDTGFRNDEVSFSSYYRGIY